MAMRTPQKKIEMGIGSGLTDLGLVEPGKGPVKDDNKGNVFNVLATDPRWDLVPHLKGRRLTEEQMQEALKNVHVSETKRTKRK